MDNSDILRRVEAAITDPKEREYFLVHEARYKYILEKIQSIAKTDSRLPACAGRRGNGKGMRVLDVGCFPYHLGAAMEMMGFDVWGISSNHEPIERKKIKICNIETDKFPFIDNFFDLVVCTEVLEHLPQSPVRALSEMRRVLTARGKLLLTTPNIARSINRAKLLLGKSVTYPLQQILENDGEGSNIYHRHNREYTLKELTTILTHTHFSVDTATTFVSYTPFRRRVKRDSLWLKTGKIANYIFMMMVVGLRDTLFVVAKK